MGSAMSANVSEETRRSPRGGQPKNHRHNHQERSPSASPRSVVPQHPSIRLLADDDDDDITERRTGIPARVMNSSPLSWELPFQQQPQSPTDQLWCFLRQRPGDWETAARHRLQTHPRDAAWRSPIDGSTPLHWACRRRSGQYPFTMEIARAWPAALWTPDFGGWLPLHVALLHGFGSSSSSDTDAEQALLELIRAGGTPAALAWVTPPHPEQELTVVGTALHLACRHGVSAMVLTELLLQCSSGSDCCSSSSSSSNNNNNNNNNALQRLLTSPEPKFPADLLYHFFQKQQQHGWELDSEDANCKLLQRWNLLMAAFQGCPLTGPTDDRWIGIMNDDPHHTPPLLSLHQVLEFERECATPPHSVISVYLQFYPHAARTVRQGRLPLHTACALAREEPTITMILRANPTAVRVRDATTGQLPLHVLLLLKNNHAIPHSVFQTLVRAHAHALQTRCPVTRLLPFQMAAVPPPDNENDDNNKRNSHIRAAPLEDTHTTTTTNLIYTLLRACPQVL